jgi:hypothetical protein
MNTTDRWRPIWAWTWKVSRIGPRERHVVEDRVHLAIAIDDIADAERRHAHRRRPEYADARDDEKHQRLATGFQTFSISRHRDDLPPIGTIAGLIRVTNPDGPAMVRVIEGYGEGSDRWHPLVRSQEALGRQP